MKYLPEIRAPEDVRRLSEKELGALAGELRETILQTAAKNGGHFASNLGMVELTVALHRVFRTPEERIVFDVGHQAYAHKLLTGRYAQFDTLRQWGGVSGFTNRGESAFDATTAGHSGSSVSAAIGLAEAEQLRGGGNWTVAVVGDGSFTNGMIYEALNQLSSSDLRLCIVLNDNTMSISENVGGLSHYFSYIRTSRGYFTFKLCLKRFFSRIPLIGGALVRGARKIRDFIKRTTGSETFFEKLGLEYIGPVSGDDIKRLTHVLEEAKNKNCPVIVHVVTKKGEGYPDAEAHPERYHSVGPFDPDRGLGDLPVPAASFTARMSEELLRMASEDGRVVAITAAMKDGCGLSEFAETFPNRFFDVGIAEEHAVTMAGGMAIGGLCPVVVLYSTFAQRVFDQLWHDCALQNVHVLLFLSHAGLVPGDGVTHQGIYDVSLFSRLPDTEIWSPDDLGHLGRVMRQAKDAAGIAIVRYPKGVPAPCDLIREDHGDWKTAVFGEGPARERIVVVTYGRISKTVADAASCAAKKRPGTEITVAVLEKIHPLPDDRELWELMRSADRLLFVEEGIRSGGIGEALAASEKLGGKAVKIRAIEEPFVPHGSLEEITRFAGLDEESLTEWMEGEIRGFLERKPGKEL